MDKAWVWLPRASLEYAQGAKQFVTDSMRLLGNPVEMLCPCTNCRNVCHQVIETVIDHLVIKGMDHKYKRNACWSYHGDVRNTNRDDFQNSESEAYELIKTAFANEDSTQQANNIEDQSEGCETTEDSEFRQKLKDAETPLYATSPNHTKVSAIMGLYRIKVKSGMSENFFDQLLALVHDMLPQDNVLPKSTDEMKKFLKIFGFGYDMIHACKNDCILYRNAVILSVDFVFKPDAYLWRPSEDKSTIGEAVNTNIAWPLHKIELLNLPTQAESVTKTAATASNSTNNSNGNPKKKCIMFDCNNSGRIVAEGGVFSSDPADIIHHAALGPNASKVMVRVSKIDDAMVWRPTSEFQVMSDTVGSIVAWPNEKLKFV